MLRLLRTSLGSYLIVMGCGPGVAATDDGTTTHGDDTAAVPPEPTTSDTQPNTSSSSSGTSAGASDDLDSGFETGGISFVADPDLGMGSGAECDIAIQNCPPGEKCTWGQGDPRCVPIPDDPVQPGDPCTVTEIEPFGDVDDCAQGGLCWWVDRETGFGTCYPMCTASSSYPVCDDPQTYCAISGEGPPLCLEWCDPLGADCAEDEGCYPIDSWWRCAPVAEDAGQYGDACMFVNGCQPGLMCLSSRVFTACAPENPGCCGEVCSLEDPMCTSPEPETMCTPWFEEDNAPVGLEHVGACLEVPLR